MNVHDLLALDARVRACGSVEFDFSGLSDCDLLAVGVLISARRPAHDVFDRDDLVRKAAHLWVALGCTGFSGSGANRLVLFNASDYVYKLSRNPLGELSSDIEAQGQLEIPIARSEWQVIDGVRVLRMERVAPVSASEFDALRCDHRWIETVDRKQVGWTKSGQLVCYDAGQHGDFNRDLL